MNEIEEEPHVFILAFTFQEAMEFSHQRGITRFTYLNYPEQLYGHWKKTVYKVGDWMRKQHLDIYEQLFRTREMEVIHVA